MPIYTFRCPKCSNEVEKLISTYFSKCPIICECGEVMEKVPSLPAKRRDMTVVERFK